MNSNGGRADECAVLGAAKPRAPKPARSARLLREVERLLTDQAADEDAGGDADSVAHATGAADATCLRKRGYSKDSRPNLAHTVSGFAVTRGGSRSGARCGPATRSTYRSTSRC